MELGFHVMSSGALMHCHEQFLGIPIAMYAQAEMQRLLENSTARLVARQQDLSL